jgi:hypothetical protein
MRDLIIGKLMIQTQHAIDLADKIAEQRDEWMAKYHALKQECDFYKACVRLTDAQVAQWRKQA